ncbi:MAG: hypothetical protein JW719_08140 [Pirellulales bacterium]|nr:hypothetical protein [Pirellulales bacterium]
MRSRSLIVFLAMAIAGVFAPNTIHGADNLDQVWRQAETRAILHRDALRRVDRVLSAWLKKINPETGLVPQRYDGKPFWTVANSAADIYSSLVLDAAFVNRDAMNGVLKQALTTERKHAERIGRLPDNLDIETLTFLQEEPSLERSSFGASEWCRDGLLRISEILGTDNPWFDRMAELADEVMTRSYVESPQGPLPGNIEVCGTMLQTLSRLHAATGNEKYREWAERIGEYYLFDNPPQKMKKLRLRDHGGEITPGLAEMFAMTSRADPAKAARYKEPLRDLLDRVIEVGQMPDGMFANIINPRDGKVISVGLRDRKKGANTNWGYTCNSHCTYDLITGENRYGDRIKKALAALPKYYTDDARYKDDLFYRSSSDYFADFLENAMVLYNRYPVEGVEQWVAKTIPRMWSFQREDGTVNRHYHDGSFGRTSVLFARMCSRGVVTAPWREDLCVGSVEHDGGLCVWFHADRPWSGRLRFDFPRWRESFHLPVNYPRINELTEWYVVSPSDSYQVTINNEPPKTMTGEDLIEGLPINLEKADNVKIFVQPVDRK